MLKLKLLLTADIKFSDIFETSDAAKEGFKAIKQYGKTEYLKLKAGNGKSSSIS